MKFEKMMKLNQQELLFARQLLKWNRIYNRRAMPWKGEKDPYKIWLSEIILQQTRVEQGLEYYNRFIITFPTIHHLAKAPETKVFKLWEGLGYYTRCKNLIATAKFISNELNGKFPEQYDKILQLKGIGPYTAAAISSFAFNLPHAVVDGNVFRVLARFFGIETPVDSTEGKKLFTALANNLLDKKKPGIYNQALMDFGATVCKPQQPLCVICPLKASCVAYLQGLVNVLPVKEKAIAKRLRWLYYVVIEYNGLVYTRKRMSKDIWENLYEFVLHENESELTNKEIEKLDFLKKIIGKIKFKLLDVSKIYKQQLSHQTIYGQFIKIIIDEPVAIKGYKAVNTKQLNKLPFPRLITGYLADDN
jgi:A/G-specific adenine glycosylase